MRPYLRSFLPDRTAVSPRERLRTAVGGLVGILLTGIASRLLLAQAGAPVLIAPMGASAVLLFAVPTSPLAQPWSIIGGNLVAATVGVTAAAGIGDPVVAAAVAEGVAIALMMLLRCVHPPSGAVALTAVLGGPAIARLGYGFVLWPVLANSLLLLAGALVFNNLTGRRYPHVAGQLPPARAAREPAAGGRDATSGAALDDDLDAVLAGLDQVLDISRGDLATILRQAQLRAALRPASAATCAEVMTRSVVAVAPHSAIGEAAALLRRHRIKMLPVTDEGARVVGVVTPSDLLDKAAWNARSPRLPLGRRLLLTLERGRAPLGCVEDIMTRAVESAQAAAPASVAMAAMARAGVHHLPVIDDDEKLLGVVTQSDLLAVLLKERSAAPTPG